MSNEAESFAIGFTSGYMAGASGTPVTGRVGSALGKSGKLGHDFGKALGTLSRKGAENVPEIAQGIRGIISSIVGN